MNIKRFERGGGNKHGRLKSFSKMINASRSEPQLPFAHLAREASRPCAYPQKHTVTPPIESSSTDGRSHCAGDVVYNGQREFISASGCESSPRIYVDYSNPTSYEATPPPNIMLPNLAPSGKYSGTTRCAKSMDTESRAKGMGTSSRNSAVGVGGGCSFSERVCAEERGYRGRDYGKVREQVSGLGRPGPQGIWVCPSTKSLREEARADVSTMGRPRLWRNPSGSRVREAAREELAYLKGRFKATTKHEPKRALLSALKFKRTEDAREKWMKRRALMRSERFTVQQRRNLRKWFDSLDRDGSGEIDSSELAHPLLSTGLARSSQEVADLVRHVDKDGSGEIDFDEFLAILQPRGAVKQHASSSSASSLSSEVAKAVDPAEAKQKIVKLQQKQIAGSDMSTVVVIERRALLMKEVLDEAMYMDNARDDLAHKRYLAEKAGDYRTLHALRARERRLDHRRSKKNEFISAVGEAIEFSQEREALSEATTTRNRRGLNRKHAEKNIGTTLSLLPSLYLSDEDERDGESDGEGETCARVLVPHDNRLPLKASFYVKRRMGSSPGNSTGTSADGPKDLTSTHYADTGRSGNQSIDFAGATPTTATKSCLVLKASGKNWVDVDTAFGTRTSSCAALFPSDIRHEERRK